MPQSVRKTRASQADAIVGHALDQSLSVGVRLSCNRSVLQRFLHLRHDSPRMATRDICKILLQELKELWSRAGIPIKTDEACLQAIISLFHKWDDLKKNVHRNSKPVMKKLDHFNQHLDKLLDLSPADVESRLRRSRLPRWKDDWNFLQV